MPTNPVVKTLDVLENALIGFVSPLEREMLDTFAFQRSLELK
jgi:hypothetical protein